MLSGAIRALVWVAAAGWAGISAGCGPSAWEARFEPASYTAAPREPDAPVQIREVPWETLDRALKEIQADVAASEVHPDEWPEDRKIATRAKLLRGLQVSGDASAIHVLGRSYFRTTEDVRPGDGELAAFARKVGATQVVWASTHVGRVDKVVQEPVTEYRSGWWSDYSTRDRRRPRGGSYSESSTTWVPIAVQADEYAFIAYFLHSVTP